MERNLTIRYETPRRTKKKVFRRGYHDHGTMATIDERARREANTTRDFWVQEALLRTEIYSQNPELRWKRVKELLRRQLL
jgi:hypothetical protein